MKRHDVLDLKASVSRLAALDDAAVRLVEGVFLVHVEGLAKKSERRGHRTRALGPDVRPLVEEAHRLGAPTLATFRASIESARAPTPIDARLLATLQRDLRRVSSASARTTIEAEPRMFRRFPKVDVAFLEHRENQLEMLAAARRAELPAAGLEGVLALVAAVRGKGVAERARALVSAIGREARAGHETATTRLRSLRSLPEEDEVARSLRAVERLPGRARARRIARLLGSAVARPPPLVAGDRPFAMQVEMAIDALIRAFESDATLPPDFDARVERCVGAYALLVSGADRVPEIGITAADLLAAEGRLASLGRDLEGRALDPAEAIALAVPNISPPQTGKLAGWVEEGLPLEQVQAAIAAEALDSLLKVEGDARVAAAWAGWITKLVPHFRALGLEVSFDPGVLRGVRASQEELAVLAQCLVEQGSFESKSIESSLAALDATLALFSRAPLRVRDAIRAVRETASGEGRARFPAFAEFVDDDARVDRFLHLARLAGEVAAPSEALLEDAQLLDELRRQLAHLEAMDDTSEVQRARIETLRASLSAGKPSPDRTRRRLDARIRALLPRAYGVVLERILGEVLREAWGIAPRATRNGKSSPAWRDAVRFFLTIEDNREHLRTLLRHAALHPGVPIERTLPKNRAFIEELRDGVDFDVFLSRRRTELVIDGARYSIELEEDPIEVLRMGIPFDTCLSLTDGCNAASTVLNAIEANKRVLYVRDENGAIVARKLLALSEDARLLGYRLYCAVPQIHSTLEIKVDSFCRAFADAARVELADTGEPRKLHDGFWYDDGPTAWPALSPGTDVARYCEHLGRPVPEAAPTRLCDEARRFAARTSGDVARMGRALPSWLEGPGDALLGDELVAKLGLETAMVKAKRVADLASPIARALSKGSLAELATRAMRLSAVEIDDVDDALALALSRFHDEPTAIAPLMSLCRASVRAGRTRGLAHASFDLDRHFAAAPVETFLSAANRLERIHAHVAAESPRCSGCREDAVSKLRAAIEVAYARAPDPDAVISTLRSARAGELAKRLAIRVAARFPLDRDAPFGPFSALSRGRAKLPTVASTLLSLNEGALARDPELVAAIVRQGGPTGRAKLPVPRSSPFDALGDLLFDRGDFERDPIVAPFLAPQSFQPGPFELHVHRRVDGLFRQSLRGRAKDGDGTAASWLALLGDVAAIERAERAGTGHVAIGQRLPIARAIPRGGLGLHERVLAMQDAWPASVIDPVVVRSALVSIARGEQLEAAVGTLRAVKDPAWFEAILSIVDRDETWARLAAKIYVGERISSVNRNVESVAWREAILLAQKGLASEVASALSRGHLSPFDVAADRALATWSAIAGEEAAHALFRRFVRAFAEASPFNAMSVENPARRDLLLDVIVELDPARQRSAFLVLEDFETLSRLLERVGPEVSPALESAGKGAVLRSWLDAETKVSQEGV